MQSANLARAIPRTIESIDYQESIKGHHQDDDRASNVVAYGEEIYGAERFHDMMDFVTDYIDRLYPTYRRKPHPDEPRAKRAVFADKVLACVDTLQGEGVDVEDEDIKAMLRDAVRLEHDYDPQIYLVTSARVLGYWIAEEYGYDSIKGTEYEYGA